MPAANAVDNSSTSGATPAQGQGNEQDQAAFNQSLQGMIKTTMGMASSGAIKAMQEAQKVFKDAEQEG